MAKTEDTITEEQSIAEARRIDAMKLAELIYDIYKEKKIRQNESKTDR